ncbi:MAG: hypothetical protein JSV91_10830 [Phycisphaerales bacterium]|nr:MAG: hypothetical protein JSV91_10830 [Phycisphaerales bacterium]
MKKLPVLMGLVLAAGVASTSNAGFVNADFETGDFTGWNIAYTPNGMSAVENVVPFDLGYGESYAAQFAVGEIDYDGTEQGVILTQNMYLIGGFTYDLGLHAAAHRPTGGGNLDGGTFWLMVDDYVVTSWASGYINGGDPPLTASLDGQYTPAADGYYDVGVMITRHYILPSDTIYQYVDDFYITPAPGALALLGLAGLIGRRRR